MIELPQYTYHIARPLAPVIGRAFHALGAAVQTVQRNKAESLSITKTQLDLRAIKANQHHQRDVPVLFWVDDSKSTLNNHPFLGWVESLHGLGFNAEIFFEGRSYRHRFLGALNKKKPGIVCISAPAGGFRFTQRAYWGLSEIDPVERPISIVGGVSSAPDLARYFDVVVSGPGELILPRLLHIAQHLLSYNKRNPEHALSRAEIVQRLQRAVTRRFLHLSNGRRFPITVPLSGFDLPASLAKKNMLGRRIYTSQDGRIVDFNPNVMSLYQDARLRWERCYPGIPFPLGITRFISLIQPNAIDPLETDLFMGRFHHRDHLLIGKWIKTSNIESHLKNAMVMTQWGCDGHCVFCGHMRHAPTRGRHLSAKRTVGMMWDAVRTGRDSLSIIDDNVIYDIQHAERLVEEIEKEGLHHMVDLDCQIRADVPVEKPRIRNLLSRMMRMGFIFFAGVETLMPDQAALLGKPRGIDSGEVYIGKAKRFVEFLAKNQIPLRGPDFKRTDEFNIILARYGPPAENLLNISRDLLEQVRLGDRMWKQYSYKIRYSYKQEQMPFITDAASQRISGYQYVQPEHVKVPEKYWKDVGRGFRGHFNVELGSDDWSVRGRFHIYEVGDDRTAHGIFSPEQFNWKKLPSIDRFIRLVYSSRRVLIGDVLLALYLSYREHQFSMSPSERREIKENVRQTKRILLENEWLKRQTEDVILRDSDGKYYFSMLDL